MEIALPLCKVNNADNVKVIPPVIRTMSELLIRVIPL
jgi:hypothetical protein